MSSSQARLRRRWMIAMRIRPPAMGSSIQKIARVGRSCTSVVRPIRSSTMRTRSRVITDRDGAEGQQQLEVRDQQAAAEQPVGLQHGEVRVERQRDVGDRKHDPDRPGDAHQPADRPGNRDRDGRTSGNDVHARIEVAHLAVDAVVPDEAVDAERDDREHDDRRGSNAACLAARTT